MNDVKISPKQSPERVSTHRASRATKPTLSRTTQDRIGAQLRLVYRELMEDPVPQRFLDLIDQLDKKS